MIKSAMSRISGYEKFSRNLTRILVVDHDTPEEMTEEEVRVSFIQLIHKFLSNLYFSDTQHHKGCCFISFQKEYCTFPYSHLLKRFFNITRYRYLSWSRGYLLVAVLAILHTRGNKHQEGDYFVLGELGDTLLSVNAIGGCHVCNYCT